MKFLKELLTITKFIAVHPLNTTHKVKAILNFFIWQIGTRLLSKKIIVPWVGDSKFIAGSGETGLTGNIYAGFMEYEDMIFLLHALQPTETFVDVGANIGAYTILASKVVQSHSIAFEPLPETANRLKDQIHVNRIESIVDVRNMGVGDKKGALFFTNNNDTVNKVSLAGESENTTRVEVGTLDTELTEDVQYFFKIDVEGFEYNVLEGGSKILSSPNVSAIIIELNDSGEEFGHSYEEIHQKLLNFNLTPVSYDPFKRTLKKLNGYNKDGGNTIYIRDFEKISARCKSAPLRVVHTANNIQI
jgi:FkbM family methyltransferase